ncbi:hypothetical protein AX16_000004 [Volvariella volvacea WC 439]|nr:hypothetical protein AX16_000004 [Volvariella volvacea WC 439]
MSSVYTDLQVSPRKRRVRDFDPDDDTVLTPKRLRIAPPTPPATVSRKSRAKKPAKTTAPLPAHLSRLCSIHNALQNALSHALATCAVSPTSDTGIVPNVLNHLSFTSYAGLTTQFNVDDLKRLCWLWEWDGKALPAPQAQSTSNDDDNPFLDAPTTSSATGNDWTRGGMGFVLNPTTHFSKTDKKRVPAYGIGIEVEMDIDKDMGGGMAAIARWTAVSDRRLTDFREKIDKWIKLHPSVDPVPQIPSADLPQVAIPAKVSSLTRALASASPKGEKVALSQLIPPSSPTRSLSKSPVKRIPHPTALPLPSLLASPSKRAIPFPSTPSRRDRDEEAVKLVFPRTPSSPVKHAGNDLPSTPVNQRIAAPATPTTARRQALYERIRQKSLSASPSKSSTDEAQKSLSKDQLYKLGQEEIRRRCLLGRLGGVAESVWMLFSNPAGGTPSTPSVRKRKALPAPDVIAAVIKSSPVPISTADANESLTMLTALCPFFLRSINIDDEDWYEMPPPSNNASESSKVRTAAPPSPGKSKRDSASELVTRSPKRVKAETGGLREVREIIRRELELRD